MNINSYKIQILIEKLFKWKWKCWKYGKFIGKTFKKVPIFPETLMLFSKCFKKFAEKVIISCFIVKHFSDKCICHRRLTIFHLSIILYFVSVNECSEKDCFVHQKIRSFREVLKNIKTFCFPYLKTKFFSKNCIRYAGHSFNVHVRWKTL